MVGKVKLTLRVNVNCRNKAVAEALGEILQGKLEQVLASVAGDVEGFSLEQDLEPL